MTSGMLSQGRRLNVISNNMANVSTVGYKADTYTDSTFKEYIISRVGNKDKSGAAELGGGSYITAPSQLYTDYSQGALESTELPLDFALDGDGFFAVQSDNGVAYTRAGSFALDGEGYLCLPNGMRVLDPGGGTIQLGTDRIQATSDGTLYSEDGRLLGRLGVFSFADNGQLERNANGLFYNGGNPQPSAATVHWKMVERSNIDLVQQMTSMITAQRAFQSSAELSRMYDKLMDKAANNLGNV